MFPQFHPPYGFGRLQRFFPVPTSRATVSLMLGLAGLPVLSGADWPEFRGPTGQGTSSVRGLPLQWGDGTNVVWKQSIPGKGWSSPVLGKGKVYLTTAVTDGGGLSLRVLCLDARSGKVEWEREVFQRGSTVNMHGKNTHASATPVLHDGRLYVHFGHYGAACLDLKGKVIWSNNRFEYGPVHGNGGSPVVVDDKLVFSCDGDRNPFVIALSIKDGQEAWRTARTTNPKKTFSFCTPLVIEVNGRKQIISPGSGAVFAYDPKDGREIWKARYGEGYSVVPRPIYAHGLIYVSSGFDRPVVYAVRPDGQGDVTETHVAWSLTRGAPNTPSMVVHGDHLYMVSDGGIASCVQARTGEVVWQERVGGNYSSSILVADNRLYLQSEEGEGVVLALGPEFRVLQRNRLGEKTLASLALDGKDLLLRGENHLYRIGTR